MRSLLLAFGLAALYLLSIGPALQLNKRGVISPDTLERFYFPLSFISQIPGAGIVLEKYLELWDAPEPSP
jgi:hypothetical protein